MSDIGLADRFLWFCATAFQTSSQQGAAAERKQMYGRIPVSARVLQFGRGEHMPDPPVPLARIPFAEDSEVFEVEGVDVTETLYCTCGSTAFVPTVNLTKHDGRPAPTPLYLCVRCGSAWRVQVAERVFEQVTPPRSEARPIID